MAEALTAQTRYALEYTLKLHPDNRAGSYGMLKVAFEMAWCIAFQLDREMLDALCREVLESGAYASIPDATRTGHIAIDKTLEAAFSHVDDPLEAICRFIELTAKQLPGYR